METIPLMEKVLQKERSEDDVYEPIDIYGEKPSDIEPPSIVEIIEDEKTERESLDVDEIPAEKKMQIQSDEVAPEKQMQILPEEVVDKADVEHEKVHIDIIPPKPIKREELF